MQRAIGKRGTGIILALIFLPAFLVFAGDFWVKNFLRLNYAYESIPVVNNIFHITVIFNKGAAFGIFQGKTPFLIFITIFLIALFSFFILLEKDFRKLTLIAYGLILGGALSNLYDRVVLGYVVDYLDFRVWPVFNLADSCIFIGVAVLLFQSFSHGKNHAKTIKG